MSNIATINTKSVREQAEEELKAERSKIAKDALKIKLRELDRAKAIVANIERQISDLEESIGDGSFAG